MTGLTRRTLLGALAALPSLPAQPPRPSGLRITKLVVHKVTLRWRALLFVEVHTDGGLVGLGEGSLHSRCSIVEEALRWLEPHLVGQDPAGAEYHWNRNYYVLSRWRGGPVLVTALSAIDLALWDLEGKRLGVPVWRLLGGPIRKQFRVYYTHWNNTMKDTSPTAFSERAAASVEKGWTAVKFAVPLADTENARIEQTTRKLEAIRSAVGPRLDVGLELFESFTSRSAIQFAQGVAPYKPMFIEEPVQRENSPAFTEIAAKSPVPVATGEGLLNRYEFRQLLEARGAAIVQPDILHCGGITELRKIANLAETYGIETAPHQCYGPLGHLASLATMSVCRNFYIHEWEADDDELFQQLTDGQYPVQNKGVVTLPDTPGLGLAKIDFERFKKLHPYTKG